MRFDRFVEEALYGPLGFYTTGGRAGRHGDFLTAVEAGPLFGLVTARALDAWWREAGCPRPFVVVEGGAGRGQWCRMIRAAEPECGAALTWVAVERSEALAAEAATAADEVVAELPTSAHVVIANELLDNLPFRLLRRSPAGWDELFVVDGEPVWAECDEMPPFDAALGATVPWQQTAAAWVDEALATGAARVVCLDYGDTTETLAARPWQEWVRTYAAHGHGTDPWRSPGRQDITCEVAWDQLPGAPVVSTQADWLRRHGIDALVEEGRAVWQKRAHLGDLAAVAARSRVGEAAALTDPHGMGAFLVLEWH